MRVRSLLRAGALACLLAGPAGAQPPAPARAPIDAAPIVREHAEGRRYGHSLREQPSWWELFWRKVQEYVLQPLLSDKARFFWKYVAPVLGVIGIGWALYRLVGGEGGGLFARRDRRQAGAGAGPMLDVDDIAEVDLAALLAIALAEGRPRDVVRYRFLLALQRLADARVLAWRKDKTNRQYATEVRAAAPAAAGAFDEASRVFAWVWYGDHPLDVPAAGAAERALDRLDAAVERIGAPAPEAAR